MLEGVTVEERTIRMPVDGGRERTVTFPSPIAEVLHCLSGVVVRCEADPYVLKDRNVFGVTAGEGVWRVDARIAGSVCTALAVQGERLLATLEDGRQVTIDPRTGRLL